jgi:hypothetical protein
MPARHRAPSRTEPRATSRARIALAALVLTLGCAKSVATPDFRGRQSSGRIVLSVENQHFSDVVVYLSSGGSWQRLGEVTGAASKMLEIPSALTTPSARFSFRVHPIGGQDRDDYVTGAIYVDRGDVIELRIAGTLRMSSWWIR